MTAHPHPAILRRQLGTLGGLLLTLAVLSPSVGVFIVGNDMLRQAGSGTVGCLLAAGLIGVAVAAVYAELGSAFPHAGAEYTIAGRLLGPTAGFALLAVFMAALPIGMAVSALGIADYLQDILPGVAPRSLAVDSVLAATLIAACSIRMNAWVTGALVAAEAAALLATLVVGALHARPDGLERLLHPTMAVGQADIGSVPLSLLAVACASGIYGLNGYGGAVCFGEEIVDAPARMGRIVFLALFVGAGIIILPMAAVLVAARDLGTLYRAPAPILGFIRATGGAGLAVFVSLSVAGAVFNCMIAIALTFGRMVFAAARDGAWPGMVNRPLARLSPRFGSPLGATLVLACVTLPLCFVPMKILILINGNLNSAVYATLSACLLIGRRRALLAHSKAGGRWSTAAAWCVLAVMAALTVAGLMDRESGRPAVLACGLIFGAGMLYARFILRRGHWVPHREHA